MYCKLQALVFVNHLSSLGEIPPLWKILTIIPWGPDKFYAFLITVIKGEIDEAILKTACRLSKDLSKIFSVCSVILFNEENDAILATEESLLKES